MKSEFGGSRKPVARKHHVYNRSHRAGDMLARIRPPKRSQWTPPRRRTAKRKVSEQRYNVPSLHWL